MKINQDIHNRIIISPGEQFRVLKNAIVYQTIVAPINQRRIFLNGRTSRGCYSHWVFLDTLNPIMIGARTK